MESQDKLSAQHQGQLRIYIEISAYLSFFIGEGV